MSDLFPYQEVKLENQSVDEIVEDIGILKKIEEASKFEIGRRLVYLNETCKYGEYLPKLKEFGIDQAEGSRYRNFFLRFGKYDNCSTLGTGKIRELLRIPKGKEEEYLDKISDLNEVTAKQLREEIEKLKQEKDQERLANEEPIKINQKSSITIKKERANPTRRQMSEVMARAKGVCERCGLDLVEYHMCKEFHHIDGDCSNTVVDNLQLLCANCHKIIQYELDNK